MTLLLGGPVKVEAHPNHSMKDSTMKEEDILKYTLPKSMADYTNQNFEDYVPEKGLKSSIFVKNTVSNNNDPIKKIDEVLKSILIDKHQINEINLDSILKKKFKERLVMPEAFYPISAQ